MVKKRKAERMAEDALEEDAFPPVDLTRDAFNRHRNRVQTKLDEKPVGFVVDWGGPQQCLITKDWPSDADRKDEAGRRDLVSKLRRIKNLIGFRDEDTVHHWMHYVHERAPWMGPVSAYIMEQVLGRVRHGLKYVNFDPILLHGAPGIGKTHYAKMLADFAGTPVLVMDGASMFSAFQVAGVERGMGHCGCQPDRAFHRRYGRREPDRRDRRGGQDRVGSRTQSRERTSRFTRDDGGRVRKVVALSLYRGAAGPFAGVVAADRERHQPDPRSLEGPVPGHQGQRAQ